MDNPVSGAESSGPVYKASSFLFGNVNNHGKIEEFENDDDLVSINQIDNCQLKEVKESTDTLFKSTAITNASHQELYNTRSETNQNTPADYYDWPEALPDDIVTMESVPASLPRRDHNDDDDYDSPATPDEIINQKQFSSNISSSNHLDTNGQQPDNTDSQQQESPSTHVVTLNTPLGNLLPVEYANTPITDLFPAYRPDRKAPKWSAIFFKLPHELNLYGEFAVQARHALTLVNNSHSNLLTSSSLLPDDIPYIEEERIASSDQVTLLLDKVQPDLDSNLAGERGSWWRRAYDRALLSTSPDKATTSPDKQSAAEGEDKKTADSSLSGATNNDPSDALRESWWKRGLRNGPAKLWYDQLAIPHDADLLTWHPTTTSRSTARSVESSGQDNTSQQRPNDTEGEEDSFAPTTSDTIAADDKDHDDLDTSASSTSTAITNNNKSKVDVESQANESTNESPPDIHEPSEDIPPTIPTNTNTTASTHTPNTHFYEFELIDWESDIVYDDRILASKYNSSAPPNAANAGWIPFQGCRTVNAFQDQYQGKCPFIVGSKAISGQQPGVGMVENLLDSLALSPSSGKTATNNTTSFNPTNPGYAIFPTINPSLLNNDWTSDIIFDSQSADTIPPPPYLLTLDQNDEACLTESFSDAQISEVIASASAQSSTSSSFSFKKPAHIQAVSSSLRPATSGDTNSSGKLPSDGHPAPAASSSSATNLDILQTAPARGPRTTFQVNFGLAATRGMLTGALAKDEKGTQKMKMILGKHGLLAEDDTRQSGEGQLADTLLEQQQSTTAATESSTITDSNSTSAATTSVTQQTRDPLNLSNDDFYALRSGASGVSVLARCGPLQHATPAVDLWHPFFPTSTDAFRLRRFHRPPLRIYTKGPMAQFNMPIPVNNLQPLIERKALERNAEKAVTGGGEIFFMRTASDLTGSDGTIVLMEYSEQFPPLLSQVGMASRLVNYYRPLHPRDRSLSPAYNATPDPPDLPTGSLVYVGANDGQFLGSIRPGGYLQALENNMCRAPIYTQTILPTDFLCIRTANSFSLRRIDVAFTVGQQIPFTEVPGPNSKRANICGRDLLQRYILHQFLCSPYEPKRIKIDDIRRAFPNHSESSVRKRLKLVADFKRTGSDASWWVLRPDQRAPTVEEVRYLTTPEDYCGFFSMVSAEVRLKDAGYGEKSLLMSEENQEDEEGQPKMEEDVRAAPWNTTRAYLLAQRGNCFLDLQGAADPTGCGEAFSYSRASAKPGALFRQTGSDLAAAALASSSNRKSVTGTDADLRRLHLRDARNLLRNLGISDADLKTFKRWEIIDMVRFTSTERAKQGEGLMAAKFARGNRLSMTEQISRYREECQRIFDLQNRVLVNNELLSSDDEQSSDDDEEDDGNNATRQQPSNALATGSRGSKFGKPITSKVFNDITQGSSHHTSSSSSAPTTTNDASQPMTNFIVSRTPEAAGKILDLPPAYDAAERKLRIIRTYTTKTGQSFTRTEVLSWDIPLELYLKIIQTRPESAIRDFVGTKDRLDRQHERRERRRSQDQLRRFRNRQARKHDHRLSSSTIPGHSGGGLIIGSRRRHRPPSMALFKMRCGACGQTGHMRTNKECPMYGQKNAQAPNIDSRRRYRLAKKRMLAASALKDDDSVAAAQALTSCSVADLLASQRGTDGAPPTDNDQDRASAVSAEGGAGSTVADSPFDGDSTTVEDDVTVEGTKLRIHSGLAKAIHKQQRSDLTMKIPCKLLERLDKASALVQQAASSRLAGRKRGSMLDEEELAALSPGLKQQQGNRRRIDPKVAINHLFEGIYKTLSQISGYKVFMQPVKERDHPGYYSRIDNPIDLSQIRMKINENAYSTREEFLADFQLLCRNSSDYNGPTNAYTVTAKKMYSQVLEEFCRQEAKLMHLESLINPLLDENDLVGLGYLLQQSIDAMYSVEQTRPFHTPVDKRRYPNYYQVISEPMDLTSLEKLVKSNVFRSRDEFLAKAELILTNCVTFNGPESPLTGIARKMLEAGRRRLAQDSDTLDVIEECIRTNVPIPHQPAVIATTSTVIKKSSTKAPDSSKRLLEDTAPPPSISKHRDDIYSLATKKPRLDLTPPTPASISTNKRRLVDDESALSPSLSLPPDHDDPAAKRIRLDYSSGDEPDTNLHHRGIDDDASYDTTLNQSDASFNSSFTSALSCEEASPPIDASHRIPAGGFTDGDNSCHPSSPASSLLSNSPPPDDTVPSRRQAVEEPLADHHHSQFNVDQNDYSSSTTAEDSDTDSHQSLLANDLQLSDSDQGSCVRSTNQTSDDDQPINSEQDDQLSDEAGSDVDQGGELCADEDDDSVDSRHNQTTQPDKVSRLDENHFFLTDSDSD